MQWQLTVVVMLSIICDSEACAYKLSILYSVFKNHYDIYTPY